MADDHTPWRHVLFPTEHGGWAFLAEPALLGMLVAPGAAGALLVVAALAGFLTRPPLRIFLLDRRLGRRSRRTRMAAGALAAAAVAAALATAAAFRLAGARMLPALVAIAVAAAIALGFELRMRSRHVAAELAGAIALGGLATAIALAGGWAAAPAFGLWAVLAARAAPSILYVRARLRRERGGSTSAVPPVLAALGGTLVVAALAGLGVAPWTSVAAIGLLAARAGYGLTRAPARARARRIGLTEVAWGLLTVGLTALGVALEARPGA